MKTFKVNVDGQVYNVIVEEVVESKQETKINRPVVKSNSSVKTEIKTDAVKPQDDNASNMDHEGMAVKAPMPGSVIDIKVSEGDNIKEGDLLLILEAMKMENEITSYFTGSVKKIMISKGDTVNNGDILMVIE